MKTIPLLSIFFVLSPLISPAWAAPTVDKLLETTQAWNGKAYTHYSTGQPQLTLLKITIPPYSALAWHTHPMPNAGYILTGNLTVQDAKGNEKTFGPGQAIAEAVDVVHRGCTGAERVEILVTYSGTIGLAPAHSTNAPNPAPKLPTACKKPIENYEAFPY